MEALPNLAPVAGNHLAVNPTVGFLDPHLELRVRFPSKNRLDQRVVRVPAVAPLGRVQLLGSLELDAGDLLDDVNQLVDRHQLARCDVDRLCEVAVRRHLGPLWVVVDVHERPLLPAVALGLDRVLPAQLWPG